MIYPSSRPRRKGRRDTPTGRRNRHCWISTIIRRSNPRNRPALIQERRDGDIDQFIVVNRLQLIFDFRADGQHDIEARSADCLDAGRYRVGWAAPPILIVARCDVEVKGWRAEGQSGLDASAVKNLDAKRQSRLRACNDIRREGGLVHVKNGLDVCTFETGDAAPVGMDKVDRDLGAVGKRRVCAKSNRPCACDTRAALDVERCLCANGEDLGDHDACAGDGDFDDGFVPLQPVEGWVVLGNIGAHFDDGVVVLGGDLEEKGFKLEVCDLGGCW